MFLKKSKFIKLLVTLSLFITMTSCKFDFSESVYRKNGIRKRISSFQQFSSITEIKAPEITQSKYSVLAISDVHFGSKKERKDNEFLAWFENLYLQEDESLKPEFVVCLGDISEHGFRAEFEQYKALTDKIEEIGRKYTGNSNFKVWNEIGNHDLYNDGWNNYQQVIFPYTTFYKFTTGNSKDSFNWYFLDSGNGSLLSSQVKTFCDEIQKDPAPKVVLSHYPFYRDCIFYFTMQNTDERDLLLSAFEKSNVKLVLGGHYHPGNYTDYKDFQEIGVASYKETSRCYLLTIDEEKQSVSYKYFNFAE